MAAKDCWHGIEGGDGNLNFVVMHQHAEVHGAHLLCILQNCYALLALGLLKAVLAVDSLPEVLVFDHNRAPLFSWRHHLHKVSTNQLLPHCRTDNCETSNSHSCSCYGSESAQVLDRQSQGCQVVLFNPNFFKAALISASQELERQLALTDTCTICRVPACVGCCLSAEKR